MGGVGMAIDDDADRHLIEGLALDSDFLEVWGANGDRHGRVWLLRKTDLTLDEGRPFGSLLYARADTGGEVMVGVHWSHSREQLRCFATDRSLSNEDRNHLERDARSRVGTWVSILASIGACAALNPTARAGVLAAAHLLPERPA